MPSRPAEALRTSLLVAHHRRAEFSSGSEPLDRYLRNQASQDARRHIAAPFVLAEADGTIIGYYTLSATSMNVAVLPEVLIRRLPRYPHLPATLLGRLAVDGRFRGKGYGRFLLGDALRRSLSSEVASFAVVVDAKDEAAEGFYRREGFVPLLDVPHKLYMPMSSIVALFDH